MRTRTWVKKRSLPAGWLLLLGLLTCGILFWWGAQAAPANVAEASGPLAILAVLSAAAAVFVGPVLLVVTILWASFAFFRWFWGGAFD